MKVHRKVPSRSRERMFHVGSERELNCSCLTSILSALGIIWEQKFEAWKLCKLWGMEDSWTCTFLPEKSPQLFFWHMHSDRAEQLDVVAHEPASVWTGKLVWMPKGLCVWSAVFKRLIFEAIITFVFFKGRLINMLIWSVMKTEF